MAVTGARPSGAAAGDGKVLGIADLACGEGDEPGITRPSARRRAAAAWTRRRAARGARRDHQCDEQGTEHEQGMARSLARHELELGPWHGTSGAKQPASEGSQSEWSRRLHMPPSHRISPGGPLRYASSWIGHVSIVGRLEGRGRYAGVGGCRVVGWFEDGWADGWVYGLLGKKKATTKR